MSAATELPNVTVPGPLTFVHDAVTAPGGDGRPSSATVPSREAPAGKVTARSGPASTNGAPFTTTGTGPVVNEKA